MSCEFSFRVECAEVMKTMPGGKLDLGPGMKPTVAHRDGMRRACKVGELQSQGHRTKVQWRDGRGEERKRPSIRLQMQNHETAIAHASGEAKTLPSFKVRAASLLALLFGRPCSVF